MNWKETRKQTKEGGKTEKKQIRNNVRLNCKKKRGKEKENNNFIGKKEK